MVIDSNIVIIIGWILTAIGLVVVWITSRHQIPMLDMQTLKDATETIKNYADEVKSLREEVTSERNKRDIEVAKVRGDLDIERGKRETEEKKYNDEICILTSKIGELEEKLSERDLVIEDLRDWAERLCHQVISLGQIPVGIKVSVIKKKSGGG